MSVPLPFALVSGVILVGFVTSLRFRLTKIPSGLLLVGIGVILGLVTGWIRHDYLLTIAMIGSIDRSPLPVARELT